MTKKNDKSVRKSDQKVTENLRPTFPRAKLRRQFFLTGRNPGRRVGRNFGRNFLVIFVLHSLCRTTQQNFSPNSSQFLTPCLVTAPVTEISKFHLRELLGLGVPCRKVENEQMIELLLPTTLCITLSSVFCTLVPVVEVQGTSAKTTLLETSLSCEPPTEGLALGNSCLSGRNSTRHL